MGVTPLRSGNTRTAEGMLSECIQKVKSSGCPLVGPSLCSRRIGVSSGNSRLGGLVASSA